MAEFRTASGLVSCDAYMRTTSGLVQVDPQFRTSSGISDGGSGSSLSATVDKTYVAGAVDSPSPTAQASTDVATVSAQGGTSPYTYAWTSAGGNLIATVATSAASAFRGTVAPGDSISDTFTCTVTDAKGATATAPLVDASISNFSNKGFA